MFKIFFYLIVLLFHFVINDNVTLFFLSILYQFINQLAFFFL